MAIICPHLSLVCLWFSSNSQGWCLLGAANGREKLRPMKWLRPLLIKVWESVLTACLSVLLHASVGWSYQLSVCSVSTGEKGEKQVMKEEIDENNERQKEKETGLEIRASWCERASMYISGVPLLVDIASSSSLIRVQQVLMICCLGDCVTQFLNILGWKFRLHWTELVQLSRCQNESCDMSRKGSLCFL